MGEYQKDKTFISAVIYLHNDGDGFLAFLDKLNSIFDEHFQNFEFIIVDDACATETISAVKAWTDEIKAPLTIIHMSIWHGVESAMNAGVDVAIGDFIYEFDSAQLQYDPQLILDAFNEALKGIDIVCVCPKRLNKGSKAFYKVFNSNSGSIYKLHTDAFRLITRRAINRVHSSHSSMPYRKAAYALSGLKMSSLFFDGKIDNNQKSKTMLAINSLALYTDAGYKISIGITLFMMIVAVIELVYTMVIYCVGKPIAGWTTTMLVMSFGFLGLFFILSIVIKYLSLILDMTFRKQDYLVESVEKIQKS